MASFRIVPATESTGRICKLHGNDRTNVFKLAKLGAPKPVTGSWNQQQYHKLHSNGNFNTSSTQS